MDLPTPSVGWHGCEPVSARFEELDWRPTRLGEISLRRRFEPTLQADIYEARLGDEFLMSSAFTVAEVALEGDFFAMIASGSRFGPDTLGRHDAILVDIDHTPRHVLHPGHAGFYELPGQRRLADRLEPGGVYALWSDDPPDEGYIAVLEDVFASCEAHVVRFANPLTGGQAANTVYIATVGHG